MSFIWPKYINSLYQIFSYFRKNDISVYDGQLSTYDIFVTYLCMMVSCLPYHPPPQRLVLDFLNDDFGSFEYNLCIVGGIKRPAFDCDISMEK